MANAKALTFCTDQDPHGFDPALYSDRGSLDASSRQVFERLVEFEGDTTAIVPGLATNWDISEDGLEYVFHLRRGVTFHANDAFTPTRPLNADDVVFTFERQRVEEHPYHAYVPGTAWDRFEALSLGDLITEVVNDDNHTVRFVLGRPHAPFLASLALDFASIQSKEYADRLVAGGRMGAMNAAPIGTGPFQFAGSDGEVVRYRAYSGYWGDRAAIEELVFEIVPNAADRLARLVAGECQVMAEPGPDEVSVIGTDPNITVVAREALDVGYLAYNTQSPPFDDVRVRRALNLAIDRRAIVDAVFGVRGTVARNPIPPGMWGYSDETPIDAFDPEEARRLLAEAGVSELETAIWAMPVSRSYNPNPRLVAELIRDRWTAVGVDAEIVSYGWGDYLRLSRDLDRNGAVLLGWTGESGDPDEFLSALLTCDAVEHGNRAQWCNEGFDALVERAREVTDPAERARLYAEAQRIFKAEAPWATVAHAVMIALQRREVSGLRLDPFGGFRFGGADIEE